MYAICHTGEKILKKKKLSNRYQVLKEIKVFILVKNQKYYILAAIWKCLFPV